jgi:beta-phosphoglucomutase-like phosphatase (HAD superfamily)
LGVQPEHCAVIEDAPAGIAAANAGGMFSIGLASLDSTAQSLSNACIVVDSLRKLSPKIIRQFLTQ